MTDWPLYEELMHRAVWYRVIKIFIRLGAVLVVNTRDNIFLVKHYQSYVIRAGRHVCST